MTLALTKTVGGYLVQGMTSVGYVDAMGLTESQAMQKAKDRILQLQRTRSEEILADMRARFPEYFSQLRSSQCLSQQ